MKTAVACVIIVLALLGSSSPALADEATKQAGIVAAELSTIARHFGQRPQGALDFTSVSGEYCFDGGLRDGGHMTHYALDPAKTQEDIVDFVNAKPLLEAGIKVDTLPRHPGKLRAMTPGQWYYLPAGEMEPHHGKALPFPVLIRATDLK